ncbi:MAG TPA: adenylate/guanylate cyclase domain-containing protein [Ilumatobacteraceae bacterium]|nr:adenylate/guanylate cyclase domain-containing protein [Ilumatobacteraceae bacterium]
MVDPRLRAHLTELGATDEQLAGLENDDLIGLAGDLQLRAGLDLDLAGVARAAGCEPERVRAIYEGMGLRVEDLAGFGDGDIALISLILNDQSGIVDTVGAQLLRVGGNALSRLAEAAVAAYVQDLEHHDDGARDLVSEADRNSFASALVLVLGDALPTVFRHHMWTAVRRQRTAQTGVASPEIVRLAIGFVDLVGFTTISRFAEPAELIATIDEFERHAFEIAHRLGGRIVKSIGDEVMIAGPDARTVATIALDLIGAVGADASVAPRAGVVAGDVLFRLGDYYGSVVNLASRLTAEAVPGEVLTDQPLAGGDEFSVQPAGRRSLKGFDNPVTVWSIEPAR